MARYSTLNDTLNLTVTSQQSINAINIADPVTNGNVLPEVTLYSATKTDSTIEYRFDFKPHQMIHLRWFWSDYDLAEQAWVDIRCEKSDEVVTKEY